MKIAQLAANHRLSPAAIRHYERLGLLDERHVRRLPNGYRDFTPAASRRIELIQLGQTIGFSLEYMRTELQHWDDGTMPVADKKAILTAQLNQIDAKIASLNAIRAHIEAEIHKVC